MTPRLKKIFEAIPQTKSFADIGCDHGYIAEMVINSGKCEDVTISDISRQSLEKAEKLLAPFIISGNVKSVCCDGLKKIPHDTETVLIAGMGGEEIIKILSDSEFLPPRLILQPMKNTDKLRKFLFDIGYGIEVDYIFCDKKYYNLLVAISGKKCRPYSEKEFLFGRDNLENKSKDFSDYVRHRINILSDYREKMTGESDILKIDEELSLLREVLNEN